MLVCLLRELEAILKSQSHKSLVHKWNNPERDTVNSEKLIKS